MHSWINRAQETLLEIIENVSKEMKADIPDNENFSVRVSYVAYRDIMTKEGRFVYSPFTDDIDSIKSMIKSTEAEGGEDTAEDVQGGLKVMLMQDWTEEAAKQVFLICDAPAHGKDCNNEYHDDFPEGSPDGLRMDELMKEFKQKEIEFNVIKLDNNCDKMIKLMQEHHDELEVKDMSNQQE